MVVARIVPLRLAAEMVVSPVLSRIVDICGARIELQLVRVSMPLSLVIVRAKRAPYIEMDCC